jgi:Transposase
MQFNAYSVLDVHKETIVIAIAEAGRKAEVHFLGEIANTPDAVARMLKKLGSRYGKLHFVYEAGPCGYGLYRQINNRGPGLRGRLSCSHAKIRAGDRVKTDRRDAVTLARLSRAGELTSVWVPDEAHEAMRDLIRAREAATSRYAECSRSSPRGRRLRRPGGHGTVALPPPDCLLGVSPGAIGVDFRREVGFKDRLQHQHTPTRARRVWTVRTLRISRRTGSSGGLANWRLRSGRRLTGRSDVRQARQRIQSFLLRHGRRYAGAVWKRSTVSGLPIRASPIPHADRLPNLPQCHGSGARTQGSHREANRHARAGMVAWSRRRGAPGIARRRAYGCDRDRRRNRRHAAFRQSPPADGFSRPRPRRTLEWQQTQTDRHHQSWQPRRAPAHR